jgi:hypothetical protein
MPQGISATTPKADAEYEVHVYFYAPRSRVRETIYSGKARTTGIPNDPILPMITLADDVFRAAKYAYMTM